MQSITSDECDLLSAMFGYPWSPASSEQLAGEVLWRDVRAASKTLLRLERLGLVARVPGSKPILWYLPGEEPYALNGRQLTDEEEDAVLARLETAVGPLFESTKAALHSRRRQLDEQS